MITLGAGPHHNPYPPLAIRLMSDHTVELTLLSSSNSR